jgi:hypothetical protein
MMMVYFVLENGHVCAARLISRRLFQLLLIFLATLMLVVGVFAEGGAHDPGVRNDPSPGAGMPLPGLPEALQAIFSAGQDQFLQHETIASGLGPRMNLDNCAGCHSQPAVGGTSPAVNPEFTFFESSGVVNHETNALPFFISQFGPVREARFKSDGGVHDLFTIAGNGSCNSQQPDFATEFAKRNIIFRIPTPVFGAGLIEQIPDATILANLNSARDGPRKRSLGIRGHANFMLPEGGEVNTSGNDGTVTRFGWKAQNKSLLMFAGEAYNVEMGVSNELFPTEREENPGCQFATVPNDVTHSENTGLDLLSDIELFAGFMRLLAPPVPSAAVPGGSASIKAGISAFVQVGCSLCHTPSLTTSPISTIVALQNQRAVLWSDLALHEMGEGLADGIKQGRAAGDEFRTAPLWGLGKRIFFLHDGRTQDLVEAIHQHRSRDSEANGVINRFDALPDVAKQNLLNFLRSL